MKPYYEEAGITIYHGDCRHLLPWLEADVAITDPPYSEETHTGARTSIDEPLIDFAPITAGELWEILNKLQVRRWLVATMDWRHIAALEADPPSRFEFVRFGIWVKPNGAPQFTGDRPATGWEGVAVLHALSGEPKRWNGGGHHAVWTYPKVNSEHPTGKPLSLVGRFVSLFSEPGEKILDPFMGSGTTLVAAKNLGRRAIGIEIEERYCEVAAKRLSQGVLDFGGAA